MKKSLEDQTWTLQTASSHPLARKYHLSERQLRRAVHAGKIGFHRPGGLVIRFTHDDIVTFIEDSFRAPINRGGAR